MIWMVIDIVRMEKITLTEREEEKIGEADDGGETDH